MQIIHKITLDAEKQGMQAVIPMTLQDSNSHLIIAAFTASGRHIGIEPGSSAALYCKKPDGTEILARAVCYSGSGAYPDTVVCEVVSALTEAAGLAEARLIVRKGDSLLFSPKFGIKIEDNQFADSDIASVSEYSELIYLAGECESFCGASEAWATGTVAGEPVDSYAPQYHNNSKYYYEQMAPVDTVSEGSTRAVSGDGIKRYVDGAISSAVVSALSTPV